MITPRRKRSSDGAVAECDMEVRGLCNSIWQGPFNGPSVAGAHLHKALKVTAVLTYACSSPRIFESSLV